MTPRGSMTRLNIALERTCVEHLLQLVQPGRLERKGVSARLVGDRRVSPESIAVDLGHGPVRCALGRIFLYWFPVLLRS
jgi:hypothetical protein